MLSYKGISEDRKYFAITQTLQSCVLTACYRLFLEAGGGGMLLQTGYLCAKAVFIMLGISAKLSKVLLGSLHHVLKGRRSAFLLYPLQGCSREPQEDEKKGRGCE